MPECKIFFQRSPIFHFISTILCFFGIRCAPSASLTPKTWHSVVVTRYISTLRVLYFVYLKVALIISECSLLQDLTHQEFFLKIKHVNDKYGLDSADMLWVWPNATELPHLPYLHPDKNKALLRFSFSCLLLLSMCRYDEQDSDVIVTYPCKCTLVCCFRMMLFFDVLFISQ